MPYSLNFVCVQYGTTPLMVAVKENRTVIIEKLLELGAPINEPAKVSHPSVCGRTPEDGLWLPKWRRN